MKKYEVTGMSCAACSARVEKAVENVTGVTSCSVSLLTNSLRVEGEALENEIMEAVTKAGYGIRSMEMEETANGKKEGSKTAEEVFGKNENSILRNRLLPSLLLLVLLMYFSMGVVMWSWPSPGYFTHNPAAMGLLQLLLTGIILIINQKFFISGMKGIYHKAPNMDTLVALGAGAAFVYSTYALFQMTERMAAGEMEQAHHYLHEFYFESAAMIVTLITLGKLLEERAKGKTTNAIKGLLDLAPKTATLLENDKDQSLEEETKKKTIEKMVPVGAVKKGDIFLVKPGEAIPVDGIIQKGYGAIDESGLTGESIPADKKKGDYVYGGTLNKDGIIICEAVKVGEDTALSQIIAMMNDVAATKAPIAKIADRVSGIFVPVVITIALITVFLWLLAGSEVGFALAKGISVLVISCPCALGLATPVAIMVGNGVGAKNGILFKTAEALEETGKVQIVALDKTGTITRGEPRVTDILPTEGTPKELLIQLAYSLEKNSEHPLAKAIVDYGQENNIELKEIEDFKIFPGNGLEGSMEGKRILGGNQSFVLGLAQSGEETGEPLPGEKKENLQLLALSDQLAAKGKTPLFFRKEDRLLGIIAVADSIKEDSRQAISELKEMGIRVVMITGDQEKTARAVGSQVQVDEVIAGVLPQGKEKVISDLQKKGKVAMVGDGINDALALTKAEIGIAIGSGTDIAIDAAEVVLMKNTLMDVPAAIRLSKATTKNIHENLFWAFAYNVIGIPLAAGLWLPVFGWQLNPMFAAFAMSMSSFCVVSNALRLNLTKIRKAGMNRKINKDDNIPAVSGTKEEISEKKESEEKRMVKTMKIEGMMCGHCEAAVKKALESLSQVEEAQVSHENNQAIVILKEEIEEDILRKTVEDKDYQVISIE